MILQVHHIKKIIKDLPDNMLVMVSNKYEGDIRTVFDHKVEELYTDGGNYYRYEGEDAKEKEECLVLEIE